MITNLNAPLWLKAKNPLHRFLAEDVMQKLTVPKLAPENDIWSFYEYNDASELVPCRTLATFMLLILSPQTYRIKNYPEVPLHRAQCIIYGPPALERDEDNPNEGNEGMSGRLQARYMLTAEAIHDSRAGLKDAEKRLLLSAFRQKGNTDTKLLTRALNLRRVA